MIDEIHQVDSGDPFERRLADAQALGEAADGVASRTPHLSAKGGLSPGQRAGGWSLLGALTVFLFMAPAALWPVAATVTATLFAALIALRLASALAGALRRTSRGAAPASDADTPRLTYLVALYREANVAPALIAAIAAIDYPANRREVKLLVEADDAETIDALRRLPLPEGFELVPVPPGAPRTKPRALNYGLRFSTGDIVAVLDAEDRPAPGQAREAITAFRVGDARLAVVQAPLLAHNGVVSWIARQFDLEYAIHFLVWLPFLSRLGVPLALGGTSNYFRRACLEAAGGWDAWNVTEDADLGLRLARMGWRAATIDTPTLEEAPVRFSHWLAQRTRWMKGHIQTWLVLMRDPARAARGMGWPQFLAVQVTLGGSLLASLLHGPVMIAILVLAAAGAPIHTWAAALLGAGYSSVLLASLASRREPHALTLLTLPLYWPLLSLAMLCALWELKTRPHFWAKTPHGISSSAGPVAPPASLQAAARKRARERLGAAGRGQFRHPPPT